MDKDKQSNVMFYITFILWYVVENISTTNFQTIFGMDIKIIDKYTAYLIFGLLLLQIIWFQKYEYKEIMWICIITIFVVITTFLSEDNCLLSLWMFIVASKNIDFYTIIDIAYKIILSTAFITIFSYWMGIIPDRILYRDGLIRYSWGYSHPNVLGMRIFQAVIYFFILKVRKKKIMFILLLVAMCFSYIIPNSKTPTLLMGILMFIFIFYLICVKYQNFVRIFAKLLILFAGIFNLCSVWLCIIDIQKYPVLQTLDKYLSVRFSQCHKAYLAYGITIFGQKTYITQEERSLVGLSGYFYLDNTYMILLIKYGVIIYLIFSLGYLTYMIKLYKEKRYLLLIVFFVYSVYGIMEPSMFRFNYNILLLFMNELIYIKKPQEFVFSGIKHKRYRLKLSRSV